MSPLREVTSGKRQESASPGPAEGIPTARPLVIPGNRCIRGHMGDGMKAWGQKEWAQPSSTAQQPSDLKGYLTALGPGFPISQLPPRVAKTSGSYKCAVQCLTQHPLPPAPVSSALPLSAHGWGGGAVGWGVGLKLWSPPAEAGVRGQSSAENKEFSEPGVSKLQASKLQIWLSACCCK